MTQKYRKGDVVTIKAIVSSDFTPGGDDRQVFLQPKGHYSSILVDPDIVTMVQPFFAAGERVQTKSSVREDGTRRVKAGPVRGTVLAMHNGDVWVEFDHGKNGTVPAVELEPSTEPHLSIAA
jgi:hypothetical protein